MQRSGLLGVEAAQRRLAYRLGPAPVEVLEEAPPAPERRAAAVGVMDAGLRALFLSALDADLALHPASLAACGPVRWSIVATAWANGHA